MLFKFRDLSSLPRPCKSLSQRIALFKNIFLLLGICIRPIAGQYLIANIQLRIFPFQENRQQYEPVNERREDEGARCDVGFDRGSDGGDPETREEGVIERRESRFLRV